MWSQWLSKTLRPLRAAEEAPPAGASGTRLPELAADGMHPGADEFRSAISQGDGARAEQAALR